MERMDDLQRNGLVLFQDVDYARFGADALLLCDFLRLSPRDEVVELGSGTGVICVLGADKTGARFTGVERQEALVALAQKSAAHNGQDIRFLCADVADAPALLGHGTFTAAAANPPYFDTGEQSPNPSVALSRHGARAALETFLQSAFLLLKNGGRLFVIYPAAELTALICALRAHRLEPKRLQFVCPVENARPTRVLIEAQKLAGAGLIVEPPRLISQA